MFSWLLEEQKEKLLLTDSDLMRGICCVNIKQQLVSLSESQSLRVSEQMLELLQRISEINNNKQQEDEWSHFKH